MLKVLIKGDKFGNFTVMCIFFNHRFELSIKKLVPNTHLLIILLNRSILSIRYFQNFEFKFNDQFLIFTVSLSSILKKLVELGKYLLPLSIEFYTYRSRFFWLVEVNKICTVKTVVRGVDDVWAAFKIAIEVSSGLKMSFAVR